VRYLRFSLLFILSINVVFAKQEYLSPIKEQNFDLLKNKNDVENLKLGSSWIEPIELSASKIFNNQYGSNQKNTLYKISINQPIFKSGGIIFLIKYANSKEKFDNLSVKEQRRALIKQAVSLLFQIRRAEFQKNRQKLVLKNARIDLLRKREQYDSGLLDSGFLDNAVIVKNSSALSLLDIESSKNNLIESFEAISDLPLENAKLPVLKGFTKKEYFDESIEMKKAEVNILQSNQYKNVIISKYLPTIRVNASYNDFKNENFAFGNGINFSSADTYYQYGLSASWKFLDINILRDIESSKLDYLRAKNSQIDLKNTLEKRYAKILNNIKVVDKKLKLTYEDKDLYEKLLSDTKELFKAGQKSIYDVQTLENSFEIQKFNLKILSIDKQLLLLDLYEKSEREL